MNSHHDASGTLKLLTVTDRQCPLGNGRVTKALRMQTRAPRVPRLRAWRRARPNRRWSFMAKTPTARGRCPFIPSARQVPYRARARDAARASVLCGARAAIACEATMRELMIAVTFDAARGYVAVH